ncbi:MAG: DUF4124 domain-containing protein [Proteobacteria bacterium]|nr:DUF4124 domain-containing protein [Pseudomonadota bacterium]
MANKTWSLFLLIGAMLIITAGMASAGNIYKWVDSEGNLHFGEKAPEGIQATKVTTDTRKVDTAEPTAREIQTYKEGTQARREKEIVAQEKRLSRKEEKAMRAELCKTAREQIAQLEPKPRVLVREEDGTIRRLSDDERLERLQVAKDVEKEHCDN